MAKAIEKEAPARGMTGAPRRLSGSEVIVELLKGMGIPYVFGGGGSTLTPLTDALMDAPEIQFLLAQHESSVVAMADGFARASGDPSVAAVHVTPGTLNALGGISSAWRDLTPLVVLAGQRDTRMLGHGTLNESPDLAEVPKPYTKWSVQVDRLDRLPEFFLRAFKVATSPPPGPVFLAIPTDVLKGEMEFILPRPEEFRVSPRLRPDKEAVERAAELLAQARFPLLLIGSGVGRSRASRALIRLAETLGAPILSEVPFSSFFDFPAGHPLYAGDYSPRSSLAQEADLLLAVGGLIYMEKAYSPAPVLPKPIPILHLHINAEEIARWFPVSVGLVGDERSGLEDLQQAVEGRLGPKDRERARARGEKVGEWVASHRQQVRERGRREWDELPLRPWRVIQDIRSALGDEVVIVEECLSSAECLRGFYQTGTFFAENTQGYLGWAVSAAIGVQLALPKRRVVAFLGDGATMFGVQGLWTAAKYRVPVIYVVLKNRAYMVDRTLKQIEKRNFLGTDLGDPDIDFALLAKSLGAEGERVERPQEIIPAAKRALARAGPTVIDCLVEEENARRIFQDIHWLPWLEAHASKGYRGGW